MDLRHSVLVVGLLVAMPRVAVEAQARRFRSVTADFESTCAIGEDGRAWCWGLQASFGHRGPAPAPVSLVGVRFAEVNSAFRTTCGLGTDSIAYCVGDDANIGFRRGRHPRTPAEHRTPARLAGGPATGALRFRAVSAGHLAACAVDTSGKVWCWGRNENGQFGTGAASNDAVPVDSPASVNAPVPFASVSVSFRHACALTAEGAAWCWGTNEYGQLGDGTTTTRMVPGPVAGEHRFRSIFVNYTTTCGLTVSGDALCWGWNGRATIGDGTTENRSVPTPVAGGRRWQTIALGGGVACGLADDGAAWCWGLGTNGELGTGEVGVLNPLSRRANVWSLTPAAVVGGVRFATIDVGYDHTCGVSVDGEVWCWGGNGAGQLGLPRDQVRNIATPQRVPMPGTADATPGR